MLSLPGMCTDCKFSKKMLRYWFNESIYCISFNSDHRYAFVKRFTLFILLIKFLLFFINLSFESFPNPGPLRHGSARRNGQIRPHSDNLTTPTPRGPHRAIKNSTRKYQGIKK